MRPNDNAVPQELRHRVQCVHPFSRAEHLSPMLLHLGCIFSLLGSAVLFPVLLLLYSLLRFGLRPQIRDRLYGGSGQLMDERWRFLFIGQIQRISMIRGSLAQRERARELNVYSLTRSDGPSLRVRE